MKIDGSANLRILGVDLELGSKGFRDRPGREKMQKWFSRIDCALLSGSLALGDTAKLAERVS